MCVWGGGGVGVYVYGKNVKLALQIAAASKRLGRFRRLSATKS